jgi:hypothetical protein
MRSPEVSPRLAGSRVRPRPASRGGIPGIFENLRPESDPSSFPRSKKTRPGPTALQRARSSFWSVDLEITARAQRPTEGQLVGEFEIAAHWHTRREASDGQTEWFE